jgi:hypothetical protein
MLMYVCFVRIQQAMLSETQVKLLFKESFNSLLKNDIKGFKLEQDDIYNFNYISELFNSWTCELHKLQLITSDTYENLLEDFGRKAIKKFYPELIFKSATEKVDNLQDIDIYSFRIRENREAFDGDALLSILRIEDLALHGN